MCNAPAGAKKLFGHCDCFGQQNSVRVEAGTAAPKTTAGFDVAPAGKNAFAAASGAGLGGVPLPAYRDNVVGDEGGDGSYHSTNFRAYFAAYLQRADFLPNLFAAP